MKTEIDFAMQNYALWSTIHLRQQDMQKKSPAFVFENSF